MDGCSDVSCTPGSWSAVTDRAGPHPIPRAQYFFDHRQELRLDARNIRLCGPQPGDYKKAFADAGFQEEDVDEALYKSMVEDIEVGY